MQSIRQTSDLGGLLTSTVVDSSVFSSSFSNIFDAKLSLSDTEGLTQHSSDISQKKSTENRIPGGAGNILQDNPSSSNPSHGDGGAGLTPLVSSLRNDMVVGQVNHMLPNDEEELFAGIAEEFDRQLREAGMGGVEEGEEVDLFSSGGGLELDSGDGSPFSFQRPQLGGVLSATASSLGNEHPYGEHPSRTLFVRNINSNVEDSDLRALFGQYGDIRTLYTACKHRGFVMISYYDIRAARSAMRMLQGKPLRRRKLDIHFSIPKENPSDKDVNQGTLVVFNLDASVSNEELRQIFGEYGEVKEIRETPHKRHHKFIEFYDVRAAEAALRSLNRSDIGGKRIKLEPSRPGGARRSGNSLAQHLSSELDGEDQLNLLRPQFLLSQQQLQPASGLSSFAQSSPPNQFPSSIWNSQIPSMGSDQAQTFPYLPSAALSMLATQPSSATASGLWEGEGLGPLESGQEGQLGDSMKLQELQARKISGSRGSNSGHYFQFPQPPLVDGQGAESFYSGSFDPSVSLPRDHLESLPVRISAPGEDFTGGLFPPSGGHQGFMSSSVVSGSPMQDLTKAREQEHGNPTEPGSGNFTLMGSGGGASHSIREGLFEVRDFMTLQMQEQHQPQHHQQQQQQQHHPQHQSQQQLPNHNHNFQQQQQLHQQFHAHSMPEFLRNVGGRSGMGEGSVDAMGVRPSISSSSLAGSHAVMGAVKPVQGEAASPGPHASGMSINQGGVGGRLPGDVYNVPGRSTLPKAIASQFAVNPSPDLNSKSDGLPGFHHSFLQSTGTSSLGGQLSGSGIWSHSGPSSFLNPLHSHSSTSPTSSFSWASSSLDFQDRVGNSGHPQLSFASSLNLSHIHLGGSSALHGSSSTSGRARLLDDLHEGSRSSNFDLPSLPPSFSGNSAGGGSGSLHHHSMVNPMRIGRTHSYTSLVQPTSYSHSLSHSNSHSHASSTQPVYTSTIGMQRLPSPTQNYVRSDPLLPDRTYSLLGESSSVDAFGPFVIPTSNRASSMQHHEGMPSASLGLGLAREAGQVPASHVGLGSSLGGVRDAVALEWYRLGLAVGGGAAGGGVGAGGSGGSGGLDPVMDAQNTPPSPGRGHSSSSHLMRRPPSMSAILGGAHGQFAAENFGERLRGRRDGMGGGGQGGSGDPKKQYILDLDRIMAGEDPRTTLMIKNIPNKYTQKMLLAAIDDRHKGTYDFFYLPIDFKNKCNVGYAFINMVDPIKIVSFFHTFNGKRWEKFNSEKVASLAYGRIQGKQALIAHFQNSSLMNEDKRCRPILFHSEGPNAGDQEPFPVGLNMRPRRERSSTTAVGAGGTGPASAAQGSPASTDRDSVLFSSETMLTSSSSFHTLSPTSLSGSYRSSSFLSSNTESSSPPEYSHI